MSVYPQLTWICMCHEASNFVIIWLKLIISNFLATLVSDPPPMGWALAECHCRVPVHWGALSHYSSSPPIALRLDAPPTGPRGMPPQLVLLASLFAVHPQYHHLQNPGSSPYSSVFIRFSSHPFYSHPQVFTFSVMFISKTWSILINYSHILYTMYL